MSTDPIMTSPLVGGITLSDPGQASKPSTADSTNDGEVRDVIIVGSGPAGYTAAIYSGRAGLHPLVFEVSADAGGALMQTTEVENFPGFPDAILGPDLMAQMRSQAERFGAELIADDIVEANLSGEIKTVTDTDGNVHRAKTVILAMGAAHRKLQIEDEARLSGRGVSWCATCDGFFFRDKDIAVIGGGDSAMEEATFLTRFAKSVTVIHRRDALRASQAMIDRAMADPKIKWAWNSQVVGMDGETKLTGITLKDTVTGEKRHLEVSGVFEAIGLDPRSQLVSDEVTVDKGGYVVCDEPSTRTNLPGVFACGDLVDSHYQQAITAAGSGCRAALDAQGYLAS